MKIFCFSCGKGNVYASMATKPKECGFCGGKFEIASSASVKSKKETIKEVVDTVSIARSMIKSNVIQMSSDGNDV